MFAADRSFKVLLLGDFHYGESYGKAGERVIAEHGYQYSTRYLKPFVEAVDVTIVNLETPIVDPIEHASPLKGRKRYVHWADPAGTPRALRELGVDAVSLANNHTLDHGAVGLLESFEHLAVAQIRWFGAGRTIEEARAPYVVEVPPDFGGGEIRLFGSFQYSRRHDDEYGFYATSRSPGCAPLSERSIEAVVHPGDRASVFNVAFPHWGANYKWRSNGQRTLGRALLGADVDLVIGHGSHCIQEIDRVGDRWIVNSIGNGNFQSGGRFAQYVVEEAILPFGFWTILEVGISRSGERRLTLRLYPVYSDNRATGYQPRPVGEADFEAIFERLSRQTRARLPSDDESMSAASDELGRHISLDLGAWPANERPSRLASAVVEGGDGQGRLYQDASTRDVLEQYAAGRNLGAILNANAAARGGGDIEWVDQSTAIARFDNRRILINGYKCDESDLGSRIVQDKHLLKSFLREHGVSTPRGEIVSSANDAVQVARRLATPVVVKPRAGNKGRGITVNISSVDEISAAYERAARVGRGILVEEYIPARVEYRCLATDQECVSVVQRILPNVTGDGRSTVRELINFNNDRRALNPALFNRYIPIDEVTTGYLAKHGMDLDTVIPKGCNVTVRDVGGLSSGGEPHECFDDVDDALRSTAVAAVRAIPGLRWGGSDIIVSEETGRPYVIEINSDADISGSTYPLVGPPRDVAARMIALRLASSSPESADGPASIGVNPGARPVADILPNARTKGERVPMADMFFEWLMECGYDVTNEGPSIVKLTAADGSVGWATAEGMTMLDLSAVRRVVRRHGSVRRLLAASEVPRVLGRRITGWDQLAEFAGRYPGPFSLVPFRGEWGGHRVKVVENFADIDESLVEMSQAWFVQRRQSGIRLKVIAAEDRALVVLGQVDPRLGGDSVQRAANVAVRAVRAVPQLRWAAVDVVVSTEQAGRVFVEGLCVNPTLSLDAAVLAGTLDDAFKVIRLGIDAESRRPVGSSAHDPRRPPRDGQLAREPGRSAYVVGMKDAQSVPTREGEPAATQHLMKEIGLRGPSWTNAVVVEEAVTRGVEVSAADRGRRVVLKHGGRTHSWRWGRSSLNTRLAIMCVAQKEVSSRLLRGAGVNAPENTVFPSTDVGRAWSWASAILPVVVKPHDGAQGASVFVDLSTEREFRDAFSSAAAGRKEVLVERFHGGVEHRCLVVDGVLVGVTRRRPASVVGDGSSTVEMLVTQKNLDRGLIHKRLTLDDNAVGVLSKQGLAPNSVPEPGRRVYLRRTSNLHTGGDAIDATEEISEMHRSEIEAAAGAIPGLRVGGFDVLIPEESEEGSLSILEINSNPMISMHHFPWEGKPRPAASAILDAMFPDTART